MSVSNATALMDSRPPFLPVSDDDFQLTSRVGGQESEEAVAARTRPTSVSKETAQILRFPLWTFKDDRWKTKAESVPSVIEESRFEDLDIVEARNVEPAAPSDKAITENSRRLQLLARKYARKGLTSEEQARLDIVTERVRQLMPRVMATDLEKLEELAQRAARIREIDETVRRELGIEARK